MPRRSPLTRNQLAAFLPNPEAIKAFEGVFGGLAQDEKDILELVNLVQEAWISAIGANSTANQAVGAIDRLADAVGLLSNDGWANQAHPTSQALDYINFNKTGPRHPVVGQVGWNAADDTLDVVHSDGVTQQVGLELYARMKNSTGATLTNGSAIGFAGATSGILLAQNFIADGTIPSLYIAGVATQNIADGGMGRITTWGHVRGLDTTGTPYGETWAVGSILYVSATTAGRLTNIRPTAPSQVIPVATVLTVDAAGGVIFVRPTVTFKAFYGSFADTTDQTAAAINTAYAITWNTTSVSSGVSIGSPTSRLVVATAGQYNFQYSVQAVKSSASVGYIWIWPRVNGVDVANSATRVAIQGSTAETTIVRGLTLLMASGDYFQLMFAVDSTSISLNADAATAFAPSAPSAMISVNQVNL